MGRFWRGYAKVGKGCVADRPVGRRERMQNVGAEMTAETNGPGREPVAWIDPKYVVGRPYGTGQSPVTTYRINGWTPLYAAPPAALADALK